MDIRAYNPLPTIKKFHESPGQIRAIIGPVGSGKTSGAAMDVCYYLPHFLAGEYRITRSRWLVIRNTYTELRDTTRKTIIDPEDGWFPDGDLKVQANEYSLQYEDGIKVELFFRSCDRPQDLKKFKSFEATGYWIDESIEVDEEIKRMLKNRIGRYPPKCPVRFGIETSNPPDIEHPVYSNFQWDTPPPGPIPEGVVLANHVGFWQPPFENVNNLRPGYYDDLRSDYADNPDWVEMYIEGKPGIIVRGKLVINNFKREHHVAKEPLVWTGGELYRGWDNSGNCPACVVAQIPRPNHLQILREFHTDRMGIVDFTSHVVNQCNILWPNAVYHDWDDPAGHNQYSKREGGFTSNAELMKDECGVDCKASEQNPTARIQSLDQQLGKIDGVLIDPSCTRLINGMIGGYCYPEIGTTGEYSDKVLKNRFSHIVEALEYLTVKLFQSRQPVKITKGRYRPARSGPVAWMGA